MAANMWKNSLKNVESDNNKIVYETLLDFFLQWNSTYFLNKPRICILEHNRDVLSKNYEFLSFSLLLLLKLWSSGLLYFF